MSEQPWRKLLDVTASVAMISVAVAMGFNYFRTQRPPVQARVAVPTKPIPLAGKPSEGDAAAPVVILEFSDFECPFCKRFFSDTLTKLRSQFVSTGKARLVFQNLPLDSVHPRAIAAARAAYCANRQGHFWKMHDSLFSTLSTLGDDDIRARATSAGLDISQFADCWLDEASSQGVAAEVAEARALGIKTTPSFLVGKTDSTGALKAVIVITGAQTYASFESAINQVSRR